MRGLWFLFFPSYLLHVSEFRFFYCFYMHFIICSSMFTNLLNEKKTVNYRMEKHWNWVISGAYDANMGKQISWLDFTCSIVFFTETIVNIGQRSCGQFHHELYQVRLYCFYLLYRETYWFSVHVHTTVIDCQLLN